MSIITTAARMWLTRSWRPFVFTNTGTAELRYDDAAGLGLYVHIPFCRSLCAFCPYCKVQYEKERCDRYIDALLREIHAVGSQGRGKKRVTSCYFGGGSPALAVKRLPEILEALREHFEITEGVGIELHPQDVTVEVLTKLKNAGITKISIGIQSFAPRFLKILGRTEMPEMFGALAEVSFETVSMDFIFALPGQTLADLQADIETAFAGGANHIAIYPFIDFSFTGADIPAMSKREKRALLDGITLHCREKGYVRDSIWTFAKEAGAQYSSMTRDNFLGFGCSATTLLREQFKINTFSVEDYIACIEGGKPATSLTIRFTERQRMVYYLFWTAYSTKIPSEAFERFFGVSLKSQYGFELWLAKLLGYLTEKNGTYEMTLKGAFYYHYYENYYTLAYIDKMWGIMREEAFPKKIVL